jgi:hypothetical protein
MIPNLFWSVISLVPLACFCYGRMPAKTVYIFLGISFIAFLLPQRFYNAIQVKDLKFLKKTGIEFALKYAQYGEIINNIIRKKFPGYKLVYDIKTLRSQYNKTYGFERFHFMALLFFLFVIIFALVNRNYIWATIFFVKNIIYNVYPILLQHYTRLRIAALLNKKQSR